MPGIPDTSLPEEGRRGVYLLTNPRSASNLFQTMISKQPGFQNASYKFFDAGFASLSQLEKGPLSQWPQEERKALYDAYQAGFDSLQDELEDAQKNVSTALLVFMLERRAGWTGLWMVTKSLLRFISSEQPGKAGRVSKVSRPVGNDKGLRPATDRKDSMLCLSF